MDFITNIFYWVLNWLLLGIALIVFGMDIRLGWELMGLFLKWLGVK